MKLSDAKISFFRSFEIHKILLSEEERKYIFGRVH